MPFEANQFFFYEGTRGINKWGIYCRDNDAEFKATIMTHWHANDVIKVSEVLMRRLTCLLLWYHLPGLLIYRSNIRELIKQGNLATLEEIVIQGYGDRLI